LNILHPSPRFTGVRFAWLQLPAFVSNSSINMKAPHLLATSAIIVALAACAPKQQGGYDTTNPYGTPATANAPYQPVAPANPTYDTPAAYEDSTAASTPAPDLVAETVTKSGNKPAGKTTTKPAVAPQAATTYTVVKGDYLGKIAAKYKVSGASIMKANNMKNDTVVLGKKLIIPAR
jgi:LysM repeat protein